MAEDRRARAQSGQRGQGLRVGRFLGIPIYAGGSLFVAIGLLALLFVPTIEAFDPTLGGTKYAWALGFAVLLYLSILVHELAHAAVARALGLPVESVTLYLLGGFTALARKAATPLADLAVSAAGPAATLALAALGAIGLRVTESGTLPHLILLQLTVANVFVGIYNLLPGLPLDGGSILADLVWAATGREATGIRVAAYAGRGVAVLTAASPFLLSARSGSSPSAFYVVWALLIAFSLWQGSTAALQRSRVTQALPALSVRRLVRPVVRVPGDLPVSEARRRAIEAQAGGVLVVDPEGRTLGVVSEAAVLAVPVERQPWVTVSEVSRRLDAEIVVDEDLDGPGLLAVLGERPAGEYVVVDRDGREVGVLATADVQRALSAV